MPFTHTPKYPVVHPNPSEAMVYGNFNLKDYLTIGAFVGMGMVTGWFGGFIYIFNIYCNMCPARSSLRKVNSRFLGFIGLMAGITYGNLSSTQRLMGLYPNEEEVKRYGCYTKEELDAYAADDVPNGELVGRIPKEREWKSL